MNIALIGYRGSGKTTIGRRLADRLWWPFVDLDQLIVMRAGKSIREIFEQQGEQKFRDLETESLAFVLKSNDQVIALGGGALVRPENRQLLLGGNCHGVYLRCDPAVLAERIAADATTADMRPNLTSLGGGIEEIEKVLVEREPIYREAAAVELDVTNLTVDEAVTYIARIA